jgi:acetyltransferase-like isoleucine patch superfamily enzyme
MELMDLVKEGWKTCDILDQREYGIVRVNKQEHVNRLDTTKLLAVVGPKHLNVETTHVFLDDNYEWLWVVAHNESHRDDDSILNVISPNAKIHPTAIIGLDSHKEALDKVSGRYLNAKHLGNVLIHALAEIGPYSIIRRSLFPCNPTTIGSGTKINAYVNIGHQVKIGENCLIEGMTNIGGSTVIWDRVTIWMGVTIRNHLNICSDVVIGQGANVVADITEPGTYYGNPARKVEVK